VKAVAIALVVLIHAAPEQPAWYARHVVEGAARLGVPAFLLVTGFLAGLRAWSRRRLVAGCLRFLRLHVIWGLFYWAVSILRDGLPERLGWKAALLHFGEASWAGQFYFVIVVQVFFVAGVLLPDGAWRRAPVVGASAAAALGGFALLGAAPALAADLGLSPWAARPFAIGSAVWLWFYYFALGAWLGERSRDAAGPLSRLGGRGAGALVAAAVLVAAAGWPSAAALAPPHPYARLPILVGATLIGLCLPSLARRPVPRWVQRTGTETFGVFVLNPAILSLWSGLAGGPAGLAGSWLRAAATVAVAVPLTSRLRRRAGWLLP
jgi:peptidoglycan/LPS O-acetylase OafA/YrhL